MNPLVSTLDNHAKALTLIAERTSGRKDRSGRPTILHMLRVGMASSDPDGQVVGWLHDIIEDTVDDDEPVTLDTLTNMDFPPHIVTAVGLVTHLKSDGLTYRGFIQRLVKSGNKLAIRVKLNDLADNLDRLSEMSDKGEARGLRKRYRQAQMELEQVWDYNN